MAETLPLYDSESREGSEDDPSVRISEFPSNITSAVMAAPTKKPECESRSSKDSKKACLED